ncbi:hypothetical protein PIB30_085580 [Stylosanthes scabra]|uniref:Uncharacterized protein n=1 Tax=Stylosanthes scabra TaxID=79078 RepID=A0ABU6YTM2_9FABA|nr:hypothetical protein [Stylosanthes scabra]
MSFPCHLVSPLLPTAVRPAHLLASATAVSLQLVSPLRLNSQPLSPLRVSAWTPYFVTVVCLGSLCTSVRRRPKWEEDTTNPSTLIVPSSSLAVSVAAASIIQYVLFCGLAHYGGEATSFKSYGGNKFSGTILYEIVVN